MYCPNCGRKIKPNSRFCPYCGKKIIYNNMNYVNRNNYNSSSSSRIPKHHNKKLLWIFGVIIVIILIFMGFNHYSSSSNHSSSNKSAQSANYSNVKLKGQPNATIYLDGSIKGKFNNKGKYTLKHVNISTPHKINAMYKSFKTNTINLPKYYTDYSLSPLVLVNWLPVKDSRIQNFEYNSELMHTDDSVDGFFGEMSGEISSDADNNSGNPVKDKDFEEHFDMNNPSARNAYKYLINIEEHFWHMKTGSYELEDGNDEHNNPKQLSVQHKNNRTYVSFLYDMIISYPGKTHLQFIYSKWNFQLQDINGRTRIISAHHTPSKTKWESRQDTSIHGHNMFGKNPYGNSLKHYNV